MTISNDDDKKPSSWNEYLKLIFTFVTLLESPRALQ